jgi:hypothetical protein
MPEDASALLRFSDVAAAATDAAFALGTCLGFRVLPWGPAARLAGLQQGLMCEVRVQGTQCGAEFREGCESNRDGRFHREGGCEEPPAQELLRNLI